jgi:DNA-binding beta-propeller fold protein YncE
VKLKWHSPRANAGRPAAGDSNDFRFTISDLRFEIGPASLPEQSAIEKGNPTLDYGSLFHPRRRAGVLLLVLAMASAGLSAERGPVPRGSVRGIRTANKIILVGPEGDPFNMPSDAAVGPDGDLYVLDGVHHRVVVYDTEAKFRFRFGGYGTELGQLHFPLGIAAAPDAKVYVADSGNHRVQVFASNGRPLDAIALPPAPSGTPPDPTDVVVDPARERLYIADNDNHYVLVYNLTSRNFEAVWGGPGQGERQFRFPFLMDISPQGYLLVVEPINTRVQVLSPSGKFVNFIGGWGIKPGQLFRPKGVATCEDRVFVTDSYLGSVQVFDMSGSFLGVLADDAGAPMKFITPTGVAVDVKRKRLYVVELKANRVCRMDLE